MSASNQDVLGSGGNSMPKQICMSTPDFLSPPFHFLSQIPSFCSASTGPVLPLPHDRNAAQVSLHPGRRAARIMAGNENGGSLFWKCCTTSSSPCECAGPDDNKLTVDESVAILHDENTHLVTQQAAATQAATPISQCSNEDA